MLPAMPVSPEVTVIASAGGVALGVGDIEQHDPASEALPRVAVALNRVIATRAGSYFSVNFWFHTHGGNKNPLILSLLCKNGVKHTF
jgi:hypothetical protein